MRYPVITPRDHDISLADDTTMEVDCGQCDAHLTLPHLFDADRERVWYGGYCGHCGQQIEVDIAWTSEF